MYVRVMELTHNIVLAASLKTTLQKQQTYKHKERMRDFDNF
jgi:hypothetical protein